jgi:hypothetical protein
MSKAVSGAKILNHRGTLDEQEYQIWGLEPVRGALRRLQAKACCLDIKVSVSVGI